MEVIANSNLIKRKIIAGLFCFSLLISLGLFFIPKQTVESGCDTDPVGTACGDCCHGTCGGTGYPEHHGTCEDDGTCSTNCTSDRRCYSSCSYCSCSTCTPSKTCGGTGDKKICTPPNSNCPGDSTKSKTSDHNCYAGETSCTASDGCDDKTCKANCYDDEPNSAPPAPSKLMLCYGHPNNKQCIPLSNNSSRPTRIFLPADDQKIYLKAKPVSSPGTVKYIFGVTNHADSNYNYSDSTWETKVYSDNLNAGDANDINFTQGTFYDAYVHTGSVDVCDSEFKTTWPTLNGYFQINNPPEVVSVSPDSGLSGDVPDDDNPDNDCNDHNPQEFTAVFEDLDGCSDISLAALWIDDARPSVRNVSDAMHGDLKMGSTVQIYAEGTKSDGGYPIMELRIDDKPVKYFRNVKDYHRFVYWHDEPLSADQIKVAFVNDDTKGGDRNLIVDKIVLDGETYESETNATHNDCCSAYGDDLNETLCCPDGNFQYSGDSKISSGFRYYGYDFEDFTFGGSSPENDHRNYSSNTPSGGYALNSDEKICSAPAGEFDDESGDTCEYDQNEEGEHVAAWKVVSASCSGNTLTATWKVWFYDYLDSAESTYDIYALAGDKVSQFTTDDDGNVWVDKGDRQLDLDPPGVGMDINHVEGNAADTLTFYQQATDNGARDTGVRRIFDRKFYVIRDEGNFEFECDIVNGEIQGDTCTDDEALPLSVYYGTTSMTYPDIWPESGDFHTNTQDGFEGGDVVSATMAAEDRACNVNTSENLEEGNSDHDEPPIGQEWMKTLFGDTYAALGYRDPIPTDDDYFSTYWAGGDLDSDGPWDFGGPDGDLAAKASELVWRSRGYSDKNKESNWYSVLYRLALKSEWASKSSNQIQKRPMIATLDDPDNDGARDDEKDGIFVYDSSSTLTLEGDCYGRKVIFVPEADVEITPEIKLLDDSGSEVSPVNSNSACLVVARNQVTILPGEVVQDPPIQGEDIVNMAIITDGRFVSQWDGNFDKLRINGFVFADDVRFFRDLVFAENMTTPAEVVSYDPRYLILLRDMLGQRPFEQFECGNVTGDICEGW